MAIGAMIAAVTVTLGATGDLTRLGGQLLLVATAGMVGAVVSVLWRMTSGSFRMNLPTLDPDMKGTDLRLMAALRPVIGLVFALGAIVLVMGELIPLDQQDGTSQSALFAGIAFLAGFSERLAQDMFVRSGQGLAGDDTITGGAGNDVLNGINGSVDRLNCGRGRDRALADGFDRVRGCEQVRRRG